VSHGKPRVFARIALVVAALSTHVPSRADGDAEAARRAKIAVRVGSRTMTVGELEDRLVEIPSFQLATFGATRDAAVRAYVEQVVVRDFLLEAGAEARGLDKELPTSQVILRALSSATFRAAHKAIPPRQAISMDDVKKYYEDNRARFDSPQRINVWRILCKTKDEATTVLDTAKREPTITRYNDLAREHSQDKATNMRGGNLGFLAPDGTSNEAGLKADPALIRAAETVKDGEFVPQPVAEGEYFAVVWRRATVPASRRSVEEATEQIKTALYRERIDGTDKKLIDDLRAKNVKSVDYSLLGFVDLPLFDAGLTIPRSVPRLGPSAQRP
jgi:peptidyl-prolyl cis-trans isomerase C